MAALSALPGMPVPQRPVTSDSVPENQPRAAAQPQLQPPSQPQSISIKNPPSLPQPQQCYPNSFSSSPRNFPTELPDSILEEAVEGAESGSESLIEPVTPVSGRHSQDFTTLQQQDYQNLPASDQSTQNAPSTSPSKAALHSAQAPTSVPPTSAPTAAAASAVATASGPKPPTQQQDLPPTPLSRRSTRGSTGNFKRSLSNLFRRSNSQIVTSAISDSAPASDTSLGGASTITNGPPPTSRRFSMNKSSNTTRSNSPPSPGSPLEMAITNRSINGTLPAPDDFEKKNKRSSTGFSLRGRVNFAAPSGRHARPASGRRASSFDAGNRSITPRPAPQAHQEETTYPPERLPWSMPPDAGTGVKARRMSLSLPDDFTVDVAELLSEFEYQHKLLGRHGKHLGKGAASKVTLMARKGCPTELYAVKEFRGKSNRESQEEYDKKIKSEFSIAKSLHHPNIVETIRLCTDSSRWNHVMEYCSEGDLFSLVQKGWLKGDDKKKDRQCLFKQLIQGVSYLHAHGIAHRDIKLENLLITKDSKLKITDFGVSEVFCGTHPGLREAGGQCGQNMGEIRLCSPGICGSEPYIAPEVLAKKEAYDPRALDVWSSAIIMIYMSFGGAIWNRAEPGNPHFDKLVKGWEKWYQNHPAEDACISETDYPNCYALDVGINPPALRRVLLQMLNPNPAKRISIHEVLNNRWMKNVECCQLESYDDPTHLIDATKKDTTKSGTKKIFCHTHLPPKTSGSHSLGKMPGQPGY